MTLQQLEYIVALDTYKHFVTAAENCNVTQPTLTMQVKKLEEEIGIILFDRNQKPLRPTKAGKPFIRKARQVIREMNELNEMILTDKNSISGTYRLAIIPTLAPFLIPLFLPEFLLKHENLNLGISELPTNEIIRNFNGDEIDMAILSTPLDEKNLVEIPLFYEPFLLYLPDGHKLIKYDKIPPEIISSDELLLLNEGHCFREQALKICSKSSTGPHSNFNYRSGSIESLMRLTDKNMGYTLVPELSVPNTQKKDNIKRLTSPEPSREISLVVHRTFTKERLVNELKNTILSSIPVHLRQSDNVTKVGWK